METAAFFNKWVHLVTVIGMLGGTALVRFTLLPALRRADNEQTEFGIGVMRGFGILASILWMLIIITGIINIGFIWPHTTALYHRWVEWKTIAAVIMFALATAVSHPAAAFQRFRQERMGWLLAVVVIGIAIVGISAHINLMRVSGAGLIGGR